MAAISCRLLTCNSDLAMICYQIRCRQAAISPALCKYAMPSHSCRLYVEPGGGECCCSRCIWLLLLLVMHGMSLVVAAAPGRRCCCIWLLLLSQAAASSGCCCGCCDVLLCDFTLAKYATTTLLPGVYDDIQHTTIRLHTTYIADAFIANTVPLKPAPP